MEKVKVTGEMSSTIIQYQPYIFKRGGWLRFHFFNISSVYVAVWAETISAELRRWKFNATEISSFKILAV